MIIADKNERARNMKTAEEVREFWIDQVGPEGWYAVREELDDAIRTQFLETWELIGTGRLDSWLTRAEGALAYLILADQFPRNMFRESGRAFSTDVRALKAAQTVVRKEWDQLIDAPARQFFYLPFMHSESLTDQDHCVRLICERMPGAGDTLMHAQAHRHVIRKYGRFPYRNDVLGRRSTPAESAYLNAGGYAHTLRSMA
ncbi:Uncharacterized conserved protein, DUF924 family [Sulfitobacter litoralis]|uniref:Uncharacterized conserved protein, DUF924 family n=2 Tax=Sulfitobacter litoralis TaxID=335975 RepID=A0ABY0SD26_9RHOB|nr:Uncharacterized conserved protein, DUF924 family [Sulfitobacter litoralis]